MLYTIKYNLKKDSTYKTLYANNYETVAVMYINLTARKKVKNVIIFNEQGLEVESLPFGYTKDRLKDGKEPRYLNISDLPK